MNGTLTGRLTRGRSSRAVAWRIEELDVVLLAPRAERPLGGLVLVIVPLLERIPVLEQVFEPAIGAAAAEYALGSVEVIRQEFLDEPEYEPLAEIEFPLVGDARYFSGSSSRSSGASSKVSPNADR